MYTNLWPHYRVAAAAAAAAAIESQASNGSGPTASSISHSNPSTGITRSGVGSNRPAGGGISAFLPFDPSVHSVPQTANSPSASPPVSPAAAAAAMASAAAAAAAANPLFQAAAVYPAYNQLAAAAAMASSQMAELQRTLQLQQRDSKPEQSSSDAGDHDLPSSTTQEPSTVSPPKEKKKSAVKNPYSIAEILKNEEFCGERRKRKPPQNGDRENDIEDDDSENDQEEMAKVAKRASDFEDDENDDQDSAASIAKPTLSLKVEPEQALDMSRESDEGNKE